MLKGLKTLHLKSHSLLFVATLLAVLGLTTGLTPGTASAAWSDCNDGRVCFWVDIDGGGSMGWVSDTTSTCRVFLPPYVNSITSVWNRMSWPVRFYTKDACSTSIGYWYTVDPGQQINFTSWPHADSFESMKVRP